MAEKRRWSGRKTILNNELIKQISDLVIKGHTDSDLSDILGFNNTCIYTWLRKGEAGTARSIYTKFYKEYKKAKATLYNLHIKNIDKAAFFGHEWEETKTTYRNVKGKKTLIEEVVTRKKSTPSWQASAWRLQRLLPSLYHLEHLDTGFDPQEKARQVNEYMSQLQSNIKKPEDFEEKRKKDNDSSV